MQRYKLMYWGFTPIAIPDEDGAYVLHANASKEIERLNDILTKIASIAHYGGLGDLSALDALVSIRKLTIPHFKKIADEKEAITIMNIADEDIA